MKKFIKIGFCLFLPLAVAFALFDFYMTLPVEGAYDTNPIPYPKIQKESLKKRLSLCSTEELNKMFNSGLEVLRWDSILEKVNATVVSELIPESDPFFTGKHYPYDEVVDWDSRSIYYYHSHRKNEHGHFHLFYSDQKVLNEFEPLTTSKNKHPSVHLFAISMHPDGTPIGLFTTNHWITSKDWWYKGEDIQKMVGHFHIDHSYPSWPTNQWVNHMLVLFKPQIDDILKERDQKLLSSNQPLEKALNNKKMNILSHHPISIDMQMEVLEELLEERSSNN